MPQGDRACGDCNVCCYALTIEELNKPPGVVCRHWTRESYCTRYETRPSACRTFLCGWRVDALGEEWRPDRCGVVIYGAGGGHQFELIGGLDRLFWRPLVTLISAVIARNEPAYLSARAPEGYSSVKVHLNDKPELRKAVARRDFPAIMALLSSALQVSIDAPKKKVTFDAPH